MLLSEVPTKRKRKQSELSVKKADEAQKSRLKVSQHPKEEEALLQKTSHFHSGLQVWYDITFF